MARNFSRGGKDGLATCKPETRKHAAIGNWIVGVGSVADGIRSRMVFAMLVEENPKGGRFTDPLLETQRRVISVRRKTLVFKPLGSTALSKLRS